MNDWRGVQIQVGDRVVYPVRQSSRVWMTEGQVEELHPSEGKVTVTRLRASGWRGDDIKPGHRVKVGLRLITVVATSIEDAVEDFTVEIDSRSS